jgi:hypothetical protein
MAESMGSPSKMPNPRIGIWWLGARNSLPIVAFIKSNGQMADGKFQSITDPIMLPKGQTKPYNGRATA